MLGYLDSANRQAAGGWVWNPDAPDQRMDVEIVVNGSRVATVTADRFRPDLLSAGIGDGRYAFEATIPQQTLKIGPNTIEARVAGAGPLLCGAPVTVEAEKCIDYFAGDIVDNCNLRCPFCLVDYSNIRTTNRMSEATFRKWTQIMPIVRDGSFFISCLHEATLHPQLYDFLDMIPEDLRKKVFFTTNLCKPIKDRDIERLANSNIHHINVSMDSLDDELFGVLRKGGRLKIFRDNLEKLADALKASRRAPELRFITMAYRSNVAEIPAMIERSFGEWGGARHEIRYTYNVRHISDEFRREHFLSRDDWTTLQGVLARYRDRHIEIAPPPPDYEKAYVRSVNYWEMPDEEGFPATVPEYPIALRGAWDGTVRIRKREDHLSVNVNILADPAAFFLAI